MAYLDKVSLGGTLYDVTDTKGRAMIAPKEETSTASAAHANGTYFTYNDLLYRATADIAAGGTITPNTNCVAVTVGAETSELKSALLNDYSATFEYSKSSSAMEKIIIDNDDKVSINYTTGDLETVSGSYNAYKTQVSDNGSVYLDAPESGNYIRIGIYNGEPSSSTLVGSVHKNTAGGNNDLPTSLSPLSVSKGNYIVVSFVSSKDFGLHISVTGQKLNPDIIQDKVLTYRMMDDAIREQLDDTLKIDGIDENLADMSVWCDITGADEIGHYYIDYATGVITNNTGYDAYMFKNYGHKKVDCKLGLANISLASIAFYSDKPFKGEGETGETYISGVKAVNGVIDYSANIPSGCKYIVLVNRVASLASPTATIYTDISTYGQKIETNLEGITAVNTEIDTIHQAKYDDIVYLNQDIKHIIESSSAITGKHTSGKIQHTYLTMLWGSDFHGTEANFKRTMQLAKAYNIIDFVMSTGDISIDRFSDTGFKRCYIDHYQEAGKPVLTLIGNHETGQNNEKETITIDETTYSNTIAGCTALYITPYMIYNGCEQGDSGNGGYYYKDFSDYKIRLIVLNEYEMPRIDDPQNEGKYLYEYWQRYLSQTQVNWLVSTLNSVSEGWSVVVAMHQVPTTLTLLENSKFNSDGDIAFKNGQGSIVQDIIDAYISKTTLSQTYANTIGAPSTDVPDVTVSADFTAANGTFICYIVGHTHCDKIGTVPNVTNRQLVVVMTNSGLYKQNYDDLWRAEGTKSQDCLNMLVFDTVKKRVRILRIGANSTQNMTWRDMESVSYAQTT